MPSWYRQHSKTHAGAAQECKTYLRTARSTSLNGCSLPSLTIPVIRLGRSKRKQHSRPKIKPTPFTRQAGVKAGGSTPTHVRVRRGATPVSHWPVAGWYASLRASLLGRLLDRHFPQHVVAHSLYLGIGLGDWCLRHSGARRHRILRVIVIHFHCAVQEPHQRPRIAKAT